MTPADAVVLLVVTIVALAGALARPSVRRPARAILFAFVLVLIVMSILRVRIRDSRPITIERGDESDKVEWVEQSEPHRPSPPAPLPRAGAGSIREFASLDPPYARRPKRPLLLALAGGKANAAKKAMPGGTAGSPSSAAAARAEKPPVAPSAPLTPNSSAKGEVSDEPASSRPAWVDAQPDRVGDVFQMAVSVGPYPTLVQCDTELPAAIRDAIQDYAENHLDHRARGVKVQLDNLESLPQGVVAETYAETVSTSFGAMRQLHARLTFDHRASQWVREQVRDALVGQRLWYTGGAAAGVLAGLAVLWMGLRKAEGGRGKAELGM